MFQQTLGIPLVYPVAGGLVVGTALGHVLVVLRCRSPDFAMVLGILAGGAALACTLLIGFLDFRSQLVDG